MSQNAKLNVKPGERWDSIRVVPKALGFGDDMAGNGYRSIVTMFNKLLANYVNQVFEPTTRRVYSNAIEKIFSGVLNAAIYSGRTMDVPFAPVHDILRSGSISQEFKATAVILKQLSTEMDNKGLAKQYIEQDITQLPGFTRQRMVADLPVFGKLFSVLAMRCEMLKSFVQGLNLGGVVSGAVMNRRSSGTVAVLTVALGVVTPTAAFFGPSDVGKIIEIGGIKKVIAMVSAAPALTATLSDLTYNVAASPCVVYGPSKGAYNIVANGIDAAEYIKQSTAQFDKKANADLFSEVLSRDPSDRQCPTICQNRYR